MKKYISLFLVAMFVLLGFSSSASAGPGAFSLVRRIDGTSSSGVFSPSFSQFPAVGNAYILGIGMSSTSITVVSVSGGGVTWAKATSSSSNRNVELWYGLNSDGSSKTITITLSSGGGSSLYSLSEWSGIATAGALDASVGSSTSASASVMSSGSLTTGEDNELVIGLERNGSNSTFISGPTNGFTGMYVGNKPMFNQAYKVGDIASYSTSWTQGSSLPYDGIIVAFKHQ